MTDRLIRITTALAVVAVAVVAAIISYQHAYELVLSHGESSVTARLLPFTVDGLIWAASMVVLDASRQNQPVPRLAAWSLGVGIVATVGANLAHGVGHGPVGALVSAWPALALVGTFELLTRQVRRSVADMGTRDQRARQPQRPRPARAGRKPTGGLTLVSQHQRDGVASVRVAIWRGRRGTGPWPTGTSAGRCPAAGRLLVLMAGKSGGADSSSALAWPARSMPKARGNCGLSMVTG